MFRRRRAQAAPAAPPVAAPVAAEPQGLDRGSRRSNGNRYRLVARLASFGDDFFIQDDQGVRVFKVDGKVARIRDTLLFRNMQGDELCKIQQRMLRVKDTMEIEGPHGDTVAHVKKALITPIRDRYVVKIGNGPDLDVQGNILDHEFRIMNGRTTVAEVSKRWFRVRDSYGVEIAPGQDDVLILAAAVCIDQMSNPAH
jgi:uncharacterized protein YxjI